MSIWQAADMVTAEEAATVYGVEVDTRHKALCPFHPDKKSKSLSFKGKWFTCFGCGAKGDSIELVSRLFGLSRLEAAKRLNSDFALELTDDKPDPLQAVKMALARAKREEAARYAVYAHDVLDRAERIINQSTATEWDDLMMDVKLIILLARRERWEPLLDLREYGEEERKEVEVVNAILTDL